MQKLISLIILCSLSFGLFAQDLDQKAILKKQATIHEEMKKPKPFDPKIKVNKSDTKPKRKAIPNPVINAKKEMTFEEFKNYFVEQLWYLNPHWASYEGFNKYDAVLEIPSEATRFQKMTGYYDLLQKLNQYDKEKLSASEQTDKAIIKNYIESSRWYIEKYKAYEWNPAKYNLGGVFDVIANNENKSSTDRLADISEKLIQIPEYYKFAKSNLKNPTLQHLELAIQQIPGSLYVFKDVIPQLINESNIGEDERNQLDERLSIASTTISEYANWLENTYLPKVQKEGSTRSFRLGKELYEQKFKYDINSKYTAKEIFERATKERGEVQVKMYQLAKELWPKYFSGEDFPTDNLIASKKLIDEISQNHVAADDFIPAIERQLPALKAFVEENDLVYMDPDKPLVVRETPDYMAGSGAGASISSPGPYDKDGETYYNVTPLTNYSTEDAESYLREYNNYMLQILNIHEAIPGHYTQLVHANESPSIVKSILGNGTMIEGWACYAERMMLEEGYGNQEPEMWLMYYKWLLRIINNTIIDYSIHNLEMSDEAVMRLLIDGAYQEKAEAEGKLKRAKLTQVQLCSYYTGLSEILDLRDIYMRSKQKSLREFHDAFLSYGSAPVKEIKKLMMD